MPLPRYRERDAEQATANPGQRSSTLLSLFSETKLNAPGSQLHPETGGTPTLHTDPDILLAKKRIDDLDIEEKKAFFQLNEIDTQRNMWLEIEQNNRERLRTSRQIHFDSHLDHMLTEQEMAEDRDLALRRQQAQEQGSQILADYEQARTRHRQIKDDLKKARQDYDRLVREKMTGEMVQQDDEFLNPFAQFGPWGKKYGWYLLAFIVFAILVIIILH